MYPVLPTIHVSVCFYVLQSLLVQLLLTIHLITSVLYSLFCTISSQDVLKLQRVQTSYLVYSFILSSTTVNIPKGSFTSINFYESVHIVC